MHSVGGRALHHSRYFLTKLPQLPTHRQPTGRIISISLGKVPGWGGGEVDRGEHGVSSLLLYTLVPHQP